MKKRYPGPMPFSYDDRNLFFGRDQEIDYLTTLIINNQITILHGKSGYGKSSLINAGLVPNLLERFNCEIIRVRFYNYDKSNPMLPLDTLLKTIQQHLSGTPYLDGLLPVEHTSAWRYFKKMQYGALKKFPADEEGNIAAQLSYILVIDQFEELFTYPKEAVIDLAEELQEILLHRIPEEYQESLKESFRNRQNLEAYKEELSILDKDIPLKVIFSLRTERFNYLTHLVNYIPTLLNNTYKVRRMTALQVREAIIQPALVYDDEFNSPPYTYESDIVENLIDFLDADTKGEGGGKIEVFEMQIICQKLEALLIEHLAGQAQPPETLPLLFQEALILQSNTIKDKLHPFAEIIKNYYRDTIESITDRVDQLSARYLIEFKLIDQATNNRISLDNAFVKQIGISDPVLRHLIDKRIIRIEVNTVSGHSLEISHDSLVMPILNAAAEMGSLATKLSDFYETAVASKSKSGKSVRDIINDVLLEETEAKHAAAAALNDADFEMLRLNPVILEKNNKGKHNDIQAFGVKKIFQETAQQSRAKTQQSSTKGWVKRFAVASIVFVAVVVFLLVIQAFSRQRENRLSALLFMSIMDTIHSKEEALHLTQYIYDQQVLGKKDSVIIKNKLMNLLHTQEVQSEFSYFDTAIANTSLMRDEIDLSPTGDYVVYNIKNGNSEEPWGSYLVIDKAGKKIAQFEKILYAYFIHNSDVAVLAKASDFTDSLYSNTNKFANQALLFNCRTDSSKLLQLDAGQYLYPPYYSIPSRLNHFDSYRIQQTASGNLIIPVYTSHHFTQDMHQVKILGPNVDKDLFSAGSISMSKDGQRLMILQRLKHGATEMTIYDENGNPYTKFSNYDFGDFAENGSLIFSNSNSLVVHPPAGSEQTFRLNDQINYAYANGDGRTIVAEGPNTIHNLDLASRKSINYDGQLIGVNFTKRVFLARNSAGADGPDTIWRRSFFNEAPPRFFVCEEGTQSAVYNEKADALLLLTNKDKLYLLDSMLHIKAGFQLTANDLYGFSESGQRFFYVRNEMLSFFENNNKLVNLFDFDAAVSWLDQHYDNRDNAMVQRTKLKYDLRF